MQTSPAPLRALGVLIMLGFFFAGSGCNNFTPPDPAQVPDAEVGEDVATQDVQPDAPQLRQAILAGGCFWCVEAVYEMLDGVRDAESGYIGGTAETANYPDVCTKTTAHAEAVRITYDPTKITYEQLLKVFFTTAHDPTQLNRQGNDRGPQYRSAIFPLNDEQADIARAYIDQLNATPQYDGRIVTTIETGHTFYPAETNHQDFARNNPDHPYIRGVSQPKVEHTREAFEDMLRDGE
ncbi:MAG: peptide-methionine (S)-S-oxide reductase MsrA [Phycisphaerales bacterium JB063]